MILVYSDDVLNIGHNAVEIIEGIKAVFKLKGDKVEITQMYLGGEILEVDNSKGIKFWAMSSEKYEKYAVFNIE